MITFIIIDKYGIIKENNLRKLSRDELISKLQIRGINLRKYFFPLLSNLKMYSHLDSSELSNLPEANDIANKVLCLPIYPDLKLKELKKIAHYINNPDEI